LGYPGFVGQIYAVTRRADINPPAAGIWQAFLDLSARMAGSLMGHVVIYIERAAYYLFGKDDGSHA